MIYLLHLIITLFSLIWINRYFSRKTTRTFQEDFDCSSERIWDLLIGQEGRSVLVNSNVNYFKMNPGEEVILTGAPFSLDSQSQWGWIEEWGNRDGCIYLLDVIEAAKPQKLKVIHIWLEQNIVEKTWTILLEQADRPNATRVTVIEEFDQTLLERLRHTPEPEFLRKLQIIN